jgi:hypothetical protein
MAIREMIDMFAALWEDKEALKRKSGWGSIEKWVRLKGQIRRLKSEIEKAVKGIVNRPELTWLVIDLCGTWKPMVQIRCQMKHSLTVPAMDQIIAAIKDDLAEEGIEDQMILINPVPPRHL